MEIIARDLYSRLAFPCIERKIKRGEITCNQASQIYSSLKKGEDVSEVLRCHFTVSDIMLETFAKRLGKESIDGDVMLRYFTSDAHKRVIEESYRKHGDFDREECLARVGKVCGMLNDNVVVLTEKPHVYKDMFSLMPKNGDYVLVHYGSVVNIFPSKDAAKVYMI